MSRTSILPSVFIGVIITGALASVLLAHVYKQNRYIHLQKSYHDMLARKSKLQSDVAGIELDIRRLKEYSRLESVAAEMNLAYRGVPELLFVKGRRGK